MRECQRIRVARRRPPLAADSPPAPMRTTVAAGVQAAMLVMTAAWLAIWPVSIALAAPPDLAGRIAVIDGNVSVHYADDAAWSVAEVNDPISGALTTDDTGASADDEGGDAVYVGDGSEARIDLGPAMLYLRADSEIDLVTLTADRTVVRLDRGTLDMRVDTPPQGRGFSVITPGGTIRIDTDGLYRLATDDQETGAIAQVVVWRGGATLDSHDQARSLTAGEQAAVYVPTGLAISDNLPPVPDDLSPLAPQVVDAAPSGSTAPPPESPSLLYVSPDQAGYQDLDVYGQWTSTPDDGMVWFPIIVASDWVPYRHGHWRFIPPWGWTWIDNAPWGFVPFHFGRWALIGGRWGWCPGPRLARPVFAPALVAFPGTDTTAPRGRDRPPVDWVPLGPGERFQAHDRASIDQIRRINDGAGRLDNERQSSGLVNSRFRTAASAATVVTGRPAAAPPAARHFPRRPVPPSPATTRDPSDHAPLPAPPAPPGPTSPIEPRSPTRPLGLAPRLDERPAPAAPRKPGLPVPGRTSLPPGTGLPGPRTTVPRHEEYHRGGEQPAVPNRREPETPGIPPRRPTMMQPAPPMVAPTLGHPPSVAPMWPGPLTPGTGRGESRPR